MLRFALSLGLLAMLAGPGRAADVLLVRNLVPADAGEPQSVIDRFVETVQQAIEGVGIEVDLVADSELTAETLAAHRLVILPYNPRLQDSTVRLLEQYAAGGGKLGLFYTSNRDLLDLVGLEGSRYVGGDDLPALRGARFDPAVLEGAPELLTQSSWNLQAPVPGAAGAHVAATWVDADGNDTGLPALTLGEGGFMFSHVLVGSDPPGARRMMLALLGRYLDDVWPTASQARLDAIGRIGSFAGLDEVVTYVEAMDDERAARTVATAQDVAAQARAAREAGEHVRAIELADEANRHIEQAILLSQPVRMGELRGAWIHSPWGIADWGWDKTVRVLAENGFNALFPNLLWAAVADYPSEVLPVHPEVAQRGDQIAACLAACRKYGVELHVWQVTWNMGHHTPDEVKEQMRAAGRTQQSVTGEPSDYLAPHLEENQTLLREAMLEIVRNYDVDGIHFDYIRYPNAEHDFSDSARAAFEAELGQPVENWPDDAYRGELRDEYNAWRRDNITRLVRAVYEGAHAIRPDIQVSAAVFGDWANSPHSIAQATVQWIDEGLLDFVCPMNYFDNDQRLFDTLAAQVRAVDGRIPLYCGLGVWLHDSPVQSAQQLQMTRLLGADGYLLFQLSPSVGDELLPGFGLGATQGKPGPVPHRQPALRFAAEGGVAGAGEPVFREDQPLAVRVALPPGFVPGPAVTAAVLFNGWPTGERLPWPADAPPVLTFTPASPGRYQIEVSGTHQVGDEARPLLVRSQPFRVMDAAQLDELTLRQGPPRFAGDGGIKVGIWHAAYGASTLLEALRDVEGLDVAPLYNLKPESLAAADVLVLPQPRGRDVALFAHADSARAVRDYLQAGGGVLVTHALVGLRGLPTYAPEVATGAATRPGTSWLVAGEHPVTAGLGPGPHESTFGDRITLKLGDAGTVVATRPEGDPVVAVGESGEGRIVSAGLGIAIGAGDDDVPPSPAELQLVVNALRWLAQD